ncbi:MAG: hypothetical protein HON90_14745 [Halobacteriovoraceae bacterium]|jgi:hypothetical protein|nr:hypothetical protein [Halobacteriovoraceae bacterium]
MIKIYFVIILILSAGTSLANNSYNTPEAKIGNQSVKINCESQVDKVCELIGKQEGFNYSQATEYECEYLSTSSVSDTVGFFIDLGKSLGTAIYSFVTWEDQFGQQVKEPWKLRDMATVQEEIEVRHHYAGKDRYSGYQPWYIESITCN